MKIKYLSVDDPKLIVFRSGGMGGSVWVWCPTLTQSEIRQIPGLGSADRLQPDGVNSNAINEDDELYVMFVQDCFEPAAYLVVGSDTCDAYDWFVTEREDLVKIDPVDLPDYGEDYRVNDNGTPYDGEAIAMFQLHVTMVVTDLAVLDRLLTTASPKF